MQNHKNTQRKVSKRAARKKRLAKNKQERELQRQLLPVKLALQRKQVGKDIGLLGNTINRIKRAVRI